MTPHPAPTLAQQAQHAALMAELSLRLRTGLDTLLPIGRPVLLLDYPTQWDLGAHLIWQATERYIAQRGIHVLARFARQNLPPRLRGYPPETILLTLGDGGFGDQNAAQQALREALVHRHSRQRVVILPQSIHFSGRTALHRSATAFRGHPDLHLCVRDASSVRIAREHFRAQVHLLPDMAHLLWPPLLEANAPAPRRALVIGLPSESRHPHRPQPPGDYESLQSEGLLHVRERIVQHSLPGLLPLDRALSGLLAARLEKDWRACSQNWIQRLWETLRARPEVITDALHGHLLSCLMGVPNRVGDDRVGAARAYLDCWTGISPLVSRWAYPEAATHSRPTKVGEV